MQDCARKSEEPTPGRDRVEFGYHVIGPILADMLRRLSAHLHAVRDAHAPVVFFCSRGGLVLRHTLDIYAERVGLDLPLRCQDFMISRLAAFRAAFQLDPLAVAPLIEVEFAGETCSQAARALWNVTVDDDSRWNAPFTLQRLLELTRDGRLGEQIRSINDAQSSLLRRHIDLLRDGNPRVLLCDTGVFGSILRYLQVGVPAIDWRLILLFRANYKRIPAPHFHSTTGIVSESDVYLPWRSHTAVLLYWQLIEALLEPALPSVRFYHAGADGHVVSDLEIPGWQAQLEAPARSALAGACCYLRTLTPASLPSIERLAQRAWCRLRRMIVFPSARDVSLLAVGSRSLDFGRDEVVRFTGHRDGPGRSRRERISLAANSMWPEGELRTQLTRGAAPVLLAWELSRWIRALNPW